MVNLYIKSADGGFYESVKLDHEATFDEIKNIAESKGYIYESHLNIPNSKEITVVVQNKQKGLYLQG